MRAEPGGDFLDMLRGMAAADTCLVASLPAQPRPGRERAREFLYPDKALRWQDASPATLLAAADDDASVPGGALWPGSAAPIRTRWRRLDRLHPEATLIGVGDLAGAAAVLAGAAACLRTTCPVLLLDGRAPAPMRAALLAAALRQVPPGYAVRDAHAFVLAAPDLPALPGSSGARALDYPFDARLQADGLHLPEPDAPNGGRYTGAAEATVLHVPRPFGRAFRLRLFVADWGAGGPFALAVDDQTLPAVRTGPDWAEYGPIDLSRAASPVLSVHLLAAPPVIDTIRWPRKIGARLLQLSLLPA